MTKQHPTSTVARHLAGKYYAKAAGFTRDAEKMLTLAGEFSGNGIAVLCVHAAIAYTDAITVRAAGKKSKGGDHTLAATLLTSIIPIRSEEDRAAVKALRAVLTRKDEVSYADNIVGELNAAGMLDRLLTFARWATKTYEGLAPSVGLL